MKYLRFYFDVYIAIDLDVHHTGYDDEYVLVGYSPCPAVTVNGRADNCNIVDVDIALPYQTTIDWLSVNWFPDGNIMNNCDHIETQCDTFVNPDLNDVGMDRNTYKSDTTDYLQMTDNVSNSVQSNYTDGAYHNIVTSNLVPVTGRYMLNASYGAVRMSVNVVYKFADSDTSINNIRRLYPNNTEVIENTWGTPIEEWLIDVDAPTYAEALPYQNVFTVRPYGSARIYIGDDFVTKVYRGDTQITDIYVGNTKL